MPTTNQFVPAHQNPRVLDLELLALDLSSCSRCLGTLANIETAIDLVQQVLEVTGTSLRLRRVVVESAEEARQHRLLSSPTIRISGHDIVFETLENRCESCTDLCGCPEGTSCRLWSYQGAEFTEAPVGLIVEALLHAATGGQPGAAAVANASDYELPANLRDFFASKVSRGAAAAKICGSTSEPATGGATAERASCCDPDAATCGCR